MNEINLIIGMVITSMSIFFQISFDRISVSVSCLAYFYVFFLEEDNVKTQLKLNNK